MTGVVLTGWLAAPQTAPTAASARHPSPDPRDLTGTWRLVEPADPADGLAGPEDGRRPGARVATRIDLNHVCWIASGVAPATTTIYQRGSQVTMVKADSLRARRIYLGESHPQKVALTHAGHSVGRWDGNTLVIDTIALKGALETDDVNADTGRFSVIMSTPTLHVVERLTKSDDGAKLRQEMHFDDRTTGMQAYTITRNYQYAPRAYTPEAECELDGDALVATQAAVPP